MPEARSALASFLKPGRHGAGEGAPGLNISELRGLDIVQVAAWPDTFQTVCGQLSKGLSCPMPEDYRTAAASDESSVFMIAPERLWIVEAESHGLYGKLAEALASDQAAVTTLGHGRTILRISGPAARAVLAKGLPVDVDDSAFPAGSFAQSRLEEVAVLVHRREDQNGAPVFDLYFARSFAHVAYDWLVEASAEFGCEVEVPAS